MFVGLVGLPTQQSHYHKILLKPDLTNVHPYRPYVQKNEIEKKNVKERLLLGIIRSSVSPFSSPVLLV